MLPVKLSILERINQIKPRHPQPHRCPQHDRHPRIKLTPHRQPCPHWSRPQRQPQKPMRSPRESLCQGIKKDNPHRDRTQHQTQRIQNPRSTHQSQHASHHRRIRGRFGNKSRPHRCPRILLIDRPVRQPVERHRRRSRPHQTDQHSPNHSCRGNSSCSEKHRSQTKWHGKHGVRDFDKLSPPQNRKFHSFYTTTFTIEVLGGRWKGSSTPTSFQVKPSLY